MKRSLSILLLATAILGLSGCSSVNNFIKSAESLPAYHYKGDQTKSATIGSLNHITDKLFAYTRDNASLAIAGNKSCKHAESIPVDGQSHPIPADQTVTLLAYGDITYGNQETIFCPATAIVFKPEVGVHYWSKVVVNPHNQTCLYQLFKSNSDVLSDNMKLESVPYTTRNYSRQQPNNVGVCVN